MIRVLLLLLVSIILAQGNIAFAQGRTMRDLPKGDVTGLEMTVEGSKKAIPGSKFRWFVTVYEIVKGRRLRPAPGTRLDVQASFHREAAVASAVSDSKGRAKLEFDVPLDLEESFKLIVEARSSKGAKRDFDVEVDLKPRHQLEFFAEKKTLFPGESLRVWGRLLSVIDRSPISGQQVEIRTTRQQGRIRNTSLLRSDVNGVFQTTLRAPKEMGSFVIQAQAENARGQRRSLSVKSLEKLPLYVYARPERSAILSGETVWVDVVVRRSNGTPVSGATLSGLSIPRPTTLVEEERGKAKVKPVLTDIRGRARVSWKPKTAQRGQLKALREGIGVGGTSVDVRVSSDPVVLTWAVEGGSLTPGIPSRVFVRAFNAEGAALTGKLMSVSGARISSQQTTTNADGIVVFTPDLRSATDTSSSSSCSGATVAALRVQIGTFTKELCLPVNPDATLGLRTRSKVEAGKSVQVKIDRQSALPSSPISLTLLSKDGNDSWFPISQEVVPANSNSTQLLIPPEARGLLWLRARPMFGASGREVRGGSTVVWAQAKETAALTVSPNKSGAVTLSSTLGQKSGSSFSFALPTSRGRELLEELHGHHPQPGASDLHWQAFLASQIPVDRGVSALLRDNQIITLPMPEDSVALGLLRDPWRTQSRFVRGRLGRLFVEVETQLRESEPTELRDIGFKNGKRWSFNSQLLISIATSIGPKGVSGLDGTPLSVSALQRLAPEFSYDNVARRVTRERLLKTIVALRQFVKIKGLDFRWAVRGDPRKFLESLPDWVDEEGEASLLEWDLYDGWGQPMRLRKAKSGRARFRFVEPVVGYELVSAGPDGRFGNGDDVFDPFARVLQQGGVYGEAVGEEELLARLRGVELGRATIRALAEVFEVEEATWQLSDTQVNRNSWKAPSVQTLNKDVLLPQSIFVRLESDSEFGKFSSLERHVNLQLSEKPRSYMIVGGRYDSDGTAAFDGKNLHAGVPVAVDILVPERLRTNEVLDFPLRLHGLGAEQELQVRAEGTGVVRAEIVGRPQFSVKAGRSQDVSLRLTARKPGKGSVVVRVLSAQGKVIRQVRRAIYVSSLGQMRAQHDSSYVQSAGSLEVHSPKDATALRTVLTLSGPRDILKSPGMSLLTKGSPAILGWAYALRGLPMPAPLELKLSGESSSAAPMSVLAQACKAIAWSAMEETTNNQRERTSAIRRLETLSVPGTIRERSALLAALASNARTIGGSKTETRRSRVKQNNIDILIEKLRSEGWYAGRTERNRPTVMARLSAALLLADAGDMSGRGLFELARTKLVDDSSGGKRLPGEKGQAMDGWIGTLAMAIAARQMGENALAIELARSVGNRLYLGHQGDVESGFWFLAASVYGVFGVEQPGRISVRIEGKNRIVKLKNGIAQIPLPKSGAKIGISTTTPIVASMESRYLRPLTKASDSVLRASIVGDEGVTQKVAALELFVRNQGPKEMQRPVVEFLLPAAGILSKFARQRMAGRSGVRKVSEPDKMGRVRVFLTALGARQELRIPLPIEWIGSGKTRGLSTQSYSEMSPWKISSTPARTITLAPAKEENWK